MKPLVQAAILLAGSLALGGCVSVAKTAITAPFKVAGATVDALTTSQDEADRNRGRAIRKQEERDRRAARKAARDAGRGDEQPVPAPE